MTDCVCFSDALSGLLISQAGQKDVRPYRCHQFSIRSNGDRQTSCGVISLTVACGRGISHNASEYFRGGRPGCIS